MNDYKYLYEKVQHIQFEMSKELFEYKVKELAEYYHNSFLVEEKAKQFWNFKLELPVLNIM